jgi:CheY-like chemotaxis protein
VFESCGAKVTPLTSEHDLSERAHAQADLLITHFGAGGTAEDARAYRVLSSVRGWRTGPPVVVFTESSTPDQHRRDCIRRGAWEYATQWGELYRLIERLFAPGAGMTGP